MIVRIMGRIDLALEGLREYLDKDGEPDSAALELVVSGLSKAGRLRDASELLLEAINCRWVGLVPLEKTTAILAGLSMKCAKEDDYAREFVEVRDAFLIECPKLLVCMIHSVLLVRRDWLPSLILGTLTKRLLVTTTGD